MAITLSNSFPTEICIYFESAPGATPADASAWATAEGAGTAKRMYFEEFDPAFILGASEVPNADMQLNTFTVQRPHKGLPNGRGSATCRVWGTGDSYTDDTQVLGGDADFLHQLLEHALGAGALGHHTEVDTVNSQTSFDLGTVDNCEPGYIVLVEDADDPGRLFPVQVLTVSDPTITIDRQLPFTVAAGDKIYGTAMAWPDADALSNPNDAGYSTTSVLIRKGAHLAMAGGCRFELSEFKIEPGQQPKLGWGVEMAKGYPQGDGAPSAPSFAEAVEGLDSDVQAIGWDTKCFFQTLGVTTWNSETLWSMKITPGVPAIRREAVTERDDGAPALGSFGTEPRSTTLEVQVALTNSHQTLWTAGTRVTMSYFQVSSVGRVWGFHVKRGHIKGPPKPMHEGTNLWTIVVEASHDDDASGALGAKFIMFRG